MHRLVARPRVTRQAAEEAVSAWMTGPEAPGDLLRDTSGFTQVGSLERFPFLRVKGPGSDRFFPLAPLPLPDVLQLTSVPADLRPFLKPEGPAAEEWEGRHVAPDEELLRARLKWAMKEPDISGISIEERAYYPVAYRYRNEHFTAVVDAGAGRVLAVRRPPRTWVIGERLIAPPVALLLFAEAALLPTLTGRLAGVGLTAVVLLFLLRGLVARHG